MRNRVGDRFTRLESRQVRGIPEQGGRWERIWRGSMSPNRKRGSPEARDKMRDMRYLTENPRSGKRMRGEGDYRAGRAWGTRWEGR